MATPSKNEAAFSVAEELTDHWIRCNVYTMTKANTKSAVLKLYNKFRTLTNTTRARRTDKWWEQTVKPFVKHLEKGFDIRARDETAIKKQEAMHGVKETEEERAFYLDQICGERKLVCDSFVDRKWQKTEQRKRKERENQDKKMEIEKEVIGQMSKMQANQSRVEEEEEEEDTMEASEEYADKNDEDF